MEILRLPQVMTKTGMSRSAVYLAVKRGRMPEHLTAGGRSMGWLKAEIDQHIKDMVRACRGEPSPSDIVPASAVQG